MSEPAEVPHPRRGGPGGRWRTTFGPLGVAVGLVAAGVLTYELVTVAPAPEGQSATFTTSSGYVVWRLLIVLVVLTSLVGAGVAIPIFADLRRRYPNANLIPLVTVYLAAIAVTGLVPRRLGRVTTALSWNSLGLRVAILLVVVAVALAPAAGLIWIVRDRVRGLAHRDVSAPTDPVDKRIDELLALRRTLSTALGIVAGVISLTVVASGQLRLTQIAAGMVPADYPIALVVLYGALFASMLALLYVPVHLKWRDSAEALRDALYPIPADGRPDANWSEGRRRLSDLLTLDTGLARPLGAALSILSPFIVSLIGYFLPTSSP